MERNLLDAMGVARTVALDPRLLPGGGAVEMAVSRALTEKASSIEGIEQWPYRAVGAALEVRLLSFPRSAVLGSSLYWAGPAGNFLLPSLLSR